MSPDYAYLTGLEIMNSLAMSVLKGAGVSLLLAVPIAWLPIIMMRVIDDFWLAAMMIPPVMLGGYVAARRSPRPILSGTLAGVVATSLILSISLTAEELWVIPMTAAAGSVVAACGAYIAIIAGRAHSKS